MTPPPKQVAFEEFKQERGNEINRIWNENKDILTSKRRQYSDLAQKINDTKYQIDTTRNSVESKRAERISMGEFVNEMGEQIIDEEEFGLIRRLQDLKSKYRDDFDKWRELKAEIVYCQNLVEQCRQRLIQEFDSWYNEVYASQLTTSTTQGGALGLKSEQSDVKHYEDAVEKFERMQKQSMSNDPDSIAYNTARQRNDRKHVYNDALDKANHHYLSTNNNYHFTNSQNGQNASQADHLNTDSGRNMGVPRRKPINPPPNKMFVQ